MMNATTATVRTVPMIGMESVASICPAIPSAVLHAKEEQACANYEIACASKQYARIPLILFFMRTATRSPDLFHFIITPRSPILDYRGFFNFLPSTVQSSCMAYNGA